MSIAERYQRVAAEVAEAAMAAGRAPEDVLLVDVSKTVINCRGQLPDLAINTAANFLIEINAVNGDQHGKNDSQF